MPLISESFQKKKLQQFDINIKTKYIVGNNILERNTNDSVNDDIVGGIRCRKEYYIGTKLLHQEKEFDSRIEYTFISKETENKEYTCPNCGMHSKLKDFIDGCPYCRTYYNIDYSDKDLGAKYHYDRVLRNNKYRIITGVIDLIVSLILSFFFIKLTSRTFNSYDISKVFIYGLLLALILYYFFYILDAYIILTPIKEYKDRQNQKQIEFWEKTGLDKKSFFNNLNYEIRKYYYSKSNIIDFDVLDYIEFNNYQKKEELFVEVKAEIRIVTFENGKIKSKYITDKYVMKKNPHNKLELNDGVNIIKCHNCGASVDVNKRTCDYCHSDIKYLQEWILEK